MTSRDAALAGALSALAAGCAHRVPPLDASAPVRWESRVPLDGRSLTLHLSRPCTIDDAHPLVLFATGDGGWRGKDKDAYERITRWGYPVAGFSAPEYLRQVVRRRQEATPADVARDYGRFIAAAKAELSLPPATPTILVGVSRGSGLTVAAAGQETLQRELAGLVTVALTREEEYVHHLRRSRRSPDGDSELVMLDNYEYLARLSRLPLSIIQSTHDDYLPAAEARRLLGPDTSLHQLHAIESKNHSFSDARPQLYQELQRSLAWVARRHLDLAPEGR